MKTLILDAFGTLIEKRPRRTNPYTSLADAAGVEMRLPFLTRNEPISVLANELNVGFLAPYLERQIKTEIDSFLLYSDVQRTLLEWRGLGFQIAVCSNLAFEYCSAVRGLLPMVNHFIFSCEIGAAKPDPEIYATTCRVLKCRPRDALFIGDSKRADYDGPRAFGIKARLINRGQGELLAHCFPGNC
ncbi:hypothetical protein TMS3_0103960 [Pseudomonas taeanensis MS-3]|uniref:Haloacid dehalogenase n=1 Tax=Pseudomonas taeanensis MS-3 TaxID=1395571 RepID=A0A0A1YQ17_9PSED|nr:HAD family hydrolase [Pseudomonas taeanensis]KFX71103.1 hypothetical protein TMS3_0103960 [Pseudomonas taeanensis MS-3]